MAINLDEPTIIRFKGFLMGFLEGEDGAKYIYIEKGNGNKKAAYFKIGKYDLEQVERPSKAKPYNFDWLEPNEKAVTHEVMNTLEPKFGDKYFEAHFCLDSVIDNMDSIDEKTYFKSKKHIEETIKNAKYKTTDEIERREIFERVNFATVLKSGDDLYLAFAKASTEDGDEPKNWYFKLIKDAENGYLLEKSEKPKKIDSINSIKDIGNFYAKRAILYAFHLVKPEFVQIFEDDKDFIKKHNSILKEVKKKRESVERFNNYLSKLRSELIYGLGKEKEVRKDEIVYFRYKGKRCKVAYDPDHFDKEGEIVLILDDGKGKCKSGKCTRNDYVKFRHLRKGKDGKLYATGKVHMKHRDEFETVYHEEIKRKGEYGGFFNREEYRKWFILEKSDIEKFKVLDYVKPVVEKKLISAKSNAKKAENFLKYAQKERMSLKDFAEKIDNMEYLTRSGKRMYKTCYRRWLGIKGI